MPPIPPTQRMGELHDTYVAEVLGGGRTKASGAVHGDADGAQHHDEPFAFRWDAKSTKGKQIAVTLEMLRKIREQAGGERPAIPLRWYGNEALTEVLEDWVAITLLDLSEMQEAAQERDRLQEQLDLLRAEMGPLRTRLAQAEEWKATLQIQGGGGRGFDGPAIPGYIPRLPWTVIHAVSTAGQHLSHTGLRYDEQGHQSTFHPSQVRIERSATNRPRIFIDDVLVTDGALYVNGMLRVLACQANREIEVG